MALLDRNNGNRRRRAVKKPRPLYVRNPPLNRYSVNNKLRKGGAIVCLHVLDGSILPLYRFEARTIQPPTRHDTEWVKPVPTEGLLQLKLAPHLPVSCARWIQYTRPHPISLRLILTSFHLSPTLPNILFTTDLAIKIQYINVVLVPVAARSKA